MQEKSLNKKRHDMRINGRIRLGLFTLLIAIAVFLPLYVFGEENQSNSITISPAVNEIKIDPGKTEAGKIKIYNPTDTSLALRAYALNFEPADIFGGLKFTESDEINFSLEDWFSFEKQLLVPPKSLKDLSYKIKVPKEAEPGGYYASVFLETVNPQETDYESDTRITKRVGALFFVTVNGDIEEKGRVLGAASSDKCSGVECSFNTDFIREWGPVPFEFKFENTGNVHVKVKGKIEIFNLFRQKVGEIPVDEKTVLPDATRHFDAIWLREPIFGYYKAKLTINYGTLNVQDKAEVTFLAIPWKAGILVLIVSLVIVYYVLRRRKKRARKEQKWSAD